jgi:hypothetical protein
MMGGEIALAGCRRTASAKERRRGRAAPVPLEKSFARWTFLVSLFPFAVQSGAVLKLGILARGLQGVVAVPAVALGAEFLLPARGAEGADAATAPFVLRP